MKILVTGATGRLGNKVMHSLLKIVPADKLAASVRDTQKAHHLIEHGIDVRQGDFDKPETLDKAFLGIDKILIISADGDNETRIRQHSNAINAAKKAGVKFIAYTSVANAGNNPLSLAEVHRKTEQAIKDTGIPFSFLRNNWYLANETGSIKAAMAGNPWVTPLGDGKIGWATHQDYADAAAAVLTGEEHENTVYELSGPLRTQGDLVKELGNVLQKKVDIKYLDDEAYKEMLKSNGLPDAQAQMYSGMQKLIRNGALAVESSDFEKVLGRPLTPLNQGLKEIISSLG